MSSRFDVLNFFWILILNIFILIVYIAPPTNSPIFLLARLLKCFVRNP